jgi:hypothetical protein
VAEITEAQGQELVSPQLTLHHRQVQDTEEAYWDKQILLYLTVEWGILRSFERVEQDW